MSKTPSYSDGTSENASQTLNFRFEGSHPAGGKLLDVMSKPTSSGFSDGRERASSRSQALRDRLQSHETKVVALPLARFLPQHLRFSAGQRCWYLSWDARHIPTGSSKSSAEDAVCDIWYVSVRSYSPRVCLRYLAEV